MIFFSEKRLTLVCVCVCVCGEGGGGGEAFMGRITALTESDLTGAISINSPRTELPRAFNFPRIKTAWNSLPGDLIESTPFKISKSKLFLYLTPLVFFLLTIL